MSVYMKERKTKPLAMSAERTRFKRAPPCACGAGCTARDMRAHDNLMRRRRALVDALRAPGPAASHAVVRPSGSGIAAVPDSSIGGEHSRC
jgi:hypothetical protein